MLSLAYNFCLRAQGKMFGKLEDIDQEIQVLASQKFLHCHMCHEIILNGSQAVNIMLLMLEYPNYELTKCNYQSSSKLHLLILHVMTTAHVWIMEW